MEGKGERVQRRGERDHPGSVIPSPPQNLALHPFLSERPHLQRLGDASSRLSPDILCISVLAALEYTGGSRLECQALMFIVGPESFPNSFEERFCLCCFPGGRGKLSLSSTLGMASTWQPHG